MTPEDALEDFRHAAEHALEDGVSLHVLYTAVTEAFDDWRVSQYRLGRSQALRPLPGPPSPILAPTFRPGMDDNPETYNVGE